MLARDESHATHSRSSAARGCSPAVAPSRRLSRLRGRGRHMASRRRDHPRSAPCRPEASSSEGRHRPRSSTKALLAPAAFAARRGCHPQALPRRLGAAPPSCVLSGVRIDKRDARLHVTPLAILRREIRDVFFIDGRPRVILSRTCKWAHVMSTLALLQQLQRQHATWPGISPPSSDCHAVGGNSSMQSGGSVSSAQLAPAIVHDVKGELNASVRTPRSDSRATEDVGSMITTAPTAQHEQGRAKRISTSTGS